MSGAGDHADETGRLTGRPTGRSRPRPVALVTGGGSGIGAACARQLGQDGYTVLVADIDAGRAGAVAGSCPGAAGVAADVADESSVTAMVNAAAELGPLRVAVNCAAVPDDGGPVADCSWESWRRVMSVNLDGVFLCLRAEIRAMLASGEPEDEPESGSESGPAGGSIISIGSVLGLRGHPGVPAYSTAKHALIGLHRSAALRYAADGIRANVVCPGYISTPLLERRLDGDRLAALTAQHPAGRLGTADEVAALVSWLAGPGSAFVTGAVYTMDGGFTA